MIGLNYNFNICKFTEKQTKKPLLSTRGITQCAHIFPISLLPSKLFYFSTSLSQLWSQNKIQPFLYIVKTLSAATCSFTLSKTLLALPAFQETYCIFTEQPEIFQFSLLFESIKIYQDGIWNDHEGSTMSIMGIIGCILFYFFPTFQDKAKFLIKGCQLEEQALF